jgi:hypothetical protein
MLAKEAAERKLSYLTAAVETGLGTPSVFQAMKDREAEIRTLESQLRAFNEPLEQRLAVIPTWVRQQLEDAAALLLGGMPRCSPASANDDRPSLS